MPMPQMQTFASAASEEAGTTVLAKINNSSHFEKFLAVLFAI